MSFCLNEVNLIGYFGNDPESQSESKDFATVNLAINKSWKDKESGEAQSHTTWVPLLLNGYLAKFALEYLRKGSKVYVKGELRENKWKDDNGQNHSRLQVKVISLIPCSELDLEKFAENSDEKEGEAQKTQYSSRGNFYRKKLNH